MKQLEYGGSTGSAQCWAMRVPIARPAGPMAPRPRGLGAVGLLVVHNARRDPARCGLCENPDAVHCHLNGAAYFCWWGVFVSQLEVTLVVQVSCCVPGAWFQHGGRLVQSGFKCVGCRGVAEHQPGAVVQWPARCAGGLLDEQLAQAFVPAGWPRLHRSGAAAELSSSPPIRLATSLSRNVARTTLANSFRRGQQFGHGSLTRFDPQTSSRPAASAGAEPCNELGGSFRIGWARSVSVSRGLGLACARPLGLATINNWVGAWSPRNLIGCGLSWGRSGVDAPRDAPA